MMITVFDSVENIVGSEKKLLVIIIFLLFLPCFQKVSLLGLLKVRIVWYRLSINLIETKEQQQILDSSKVKEFADENFKFDENFRKLSQRVKNTVGKIEIARYEQFLLFPQCFQKTYTADMQKQAEISLYLAILTLNDLGEEAF